MPRGRKPLYLNTLGELAKPPINGWDTRTSAKSTAGQIFLRLASEGHIEPTDTPYDIWQRFSQLRLVNPHNGNFRKLISNCKKIAFPERTTPTTMSRQTDSSDDSDYDPEFEFDDEEFKNGTTVDLDEDSHPQRPDPSTNGQTNIHPLVALSQLKDRDSLHHTPTRVIPASDASGRSGTVVFVNVLAGTKAKDMYVVRSNKNKGKYAIKTKSVVKNEHSIEELFSMLHNNDPIVRQCKKAMVQYNGADARNDMNSNPPSDRRTIDLGCDHEAVLTSWVGMGKNGQPLTMPGMFFSACGRVCIMFFRKLDDKRGTVNSVSPNPYAADSSDDFGGGFYGSNWQQQQGQGVGGNRWYVRRVTYLV